MKKLLILFALLLPISLYGSPAKPPKHKAKESLENRLSRTLLAAANPIIAARKKELETPDEPSLINAGSITYLVYPKMKVLEKISHDIVHTNSIISPYIGTVTIYLRTWEPEHALYNTLEEAKHAHYKEPVDSDTAPYIFAYQHGKWIYKP